MALALADIEGKYEILSKLKEGGMGAIYKVRHRLLDEVRVVKVLRPQHEDDEELRARFAREARSAIRLRHPNVVQLFDFSVDESGTGLIVMEFIEGADLQQLVEHRRTPSLPLGLEIARQGLRSLGFLHRHGFVHRDVSPDNLMLTLDVDRRPLVKLIDLGIAKRRDAEQRLTTSGSFLGKFRYASPEHFGSRGPDGVEERSDLYTFGVVLYEVLTGRYPMAGDSTSQLIASHLFQPPMDFDASDPEGRLPEEVRGMLLRALEKDPEDRYDGAAAWIAELEELQRRWPMTAGEVAEAEELSSRLAHVPASGPTGDPGSTQHRLDRQFGLVQATPAHGVDGPPQGSDTTEEPTVATGGGSVSTGAPFEALVAGAEALLQLGQLEQAKQQVGTILSLDPGHAAATALLERIRDGSGVEATAPSGPPTSAPPTAASPTPEAGKVPEPSPAVPEKSRSLRGIAELIDAGQLTAADAALFRFAETHGENADVGALRRRLEGRRRERVATQVQSLLTEADRWVEEGEYPAALDSLKRAQAMAPAKGDLRQKLARGIYQLHKKVEARERRLAIEQIESHALHHLQDGQLDRAREEVLHGERTYGRHDVFGALHQLLDRALQERQSALVNEAGLALEAGRLADAAGCLERAREMDPDNEWVEAQLARVRGRIEGEAQEGRRRRALEQAREAELEAIGAALDRGEFDDAEADLLLAEERWGADGLEDLRRRLAEARRSEARGLVERAESARAERDVVKAKLLAAKAREVDPDASFVLDLVQILDQAAEDELEAEELAEVASLDDTTGWLEVTGEIERLRVQGQPLRAWKAVQRAIQRFGEMPALLELRKSLADELLGDP
ncbi:MAG: protein kinase [Acidobacteriota bacterium]